MNLVEVKGSEIYCDSRMVSKKFGVKNADVIGKLKTLEPKLEDFRVEGFYPKFEIEDREYRGNKYQAALMNRDLFMLLAMRYDTKRARKWQGQFIAAFNNMEKMLFSESVNKKSDKWITDRKHSKQIRLEVTDVIKDFVEYATEQGSKSAKFYYKHVTNATYKALGLLTLKKPKLRDTLDIYELSQLSTAEQLVQRSFRMHMSDKLPYKTVYKYVVKDLERFSDSLMLEQPNNVNRWKFGYNKRTHNRRVCQKGRNNYKDRSRMVRQRKNQ